MVVIKLPFYMNKSRRFTNSLDQSVTKSTGIGKAKFEKTYCKMGRKYIHFLSKF